MSNDDHIYIDNNSASMQSPTLVVFCKRPLLNQGKQRLAKDSSPETALRIANALLACAIEDAKQWQGPVVIACSEHCDIAWAKSLLVNAQVITQLPPGQTGNLGNRLNHVDKLLRMQGHQKIVVIGTDAPVLSYKHFTSVIDALNTHDIALSHADDGGVTIMANKQPWPLISELPWSTNSLSHALSTSCHLQGLSVSYSLPAYDVDHLSNLKKLYIDLKTDTRPARQALLKIIDAVFSLPKTYRSHIAFAHTTL